LSEAAVKLRGVTKIFPVSRIGSRGMKRLVIDLPAKLRGRSRWQEKQSFCALDGIDLEVAAGECLGVIGHNGSGRSTLLSLIAGVILPTTGVVETRGRICPLLELSAGFHNDLSGIDNVILSGVIQGLSHREVTRRLPEIVEFAGIGGKIGETLRTYSSGMLARLGFAVAVHLDPEILLVDEVLAVGDEAFQRKCLARIEAFRAEGVTIVYVSHDLDTVVQVCTQAVVLEKGRIIASGPADQMAESYHAKSEAAPVQPAP
jgi:ABC-2 type transport system ATP-binding protein